jgi:predicted CopG family antitoxin
MVTTIQISEELLEKLRRMKMHEKESYEDIIMDLIEDRLEISEETKRDIEEARKDVREGRITKWEDIKKELKLNV